MIIILMGGIIRWTAYTNADHLAGIDQFLLYRIIEPCAVPMSFTKMILPCVAMCVKMYHRNFVLVVNTTQGLQDRIGNAMMTAKSNHVLATEVGIIVSYSLDCSRMITTGNWIRCQSLDMLLIAVIIRSFIGAVNSERYQN